MTDAVRRNLQEILEEGDAPAEEGRVNPGLVRHLIEMGVPGEGHEEIAQTKQGEEGEKRIHAKGESRNESPVGGSNANPFSTPLGGVATIRAMRMLALLSLVAALGSGAHAHAQTASAPLSLSPAVKAQALGILREALRLEDPEQFWVAMHAAEGLTLGGYGEEVVAVLEPRINQVKDARHRCGIARELVRAGKKEALAMLVEVLRDEDAYGHTHAAESLFKVEELGDEATMRLRFQQGEDIKLRLMAAGALARKGDEKALAFIRQCRDGADPDGLLISAWLLGVLGDARDIEPLRRRLTEAPTPMIRAYIEHALACLGDLDGLIRLIRNLEDPDDSIRTYAANFAGEAKAFSTQAILEAMLQDPATDARVRAAQSLLQLSRTAP